MIRVVKTHDDITPVLRLAAANIGSLSGEGFDALRTQLSHRYKTAMSRRFNVNARGGGGWPPLAKSTQKARRGPAKGNRGKPRKFSILIDTGNLRNTLNAGATGTLSRPLPNGVEFGFAPTPHRSGGKKAPLGVDRLATIHHFGFGHNPARSILVDPPEEASRGMLADIDRAVGRALRGAR